MSDNNANTTTSSYQGRMPVFGYGSNGIEQIRDRCRNDKLQSVKAKLNGYARAFAGRSPSRQNAAVATIVPMENQVVYGSIVYLTPDEIEILDGYEGVSGSVGVYSREKIQVVDCSGKEERIVDAWTYIKTERTWITESSRGPCPHGGKPSPEYLALCKKHIEQHWSQEGGVTITIRRADTLEVVEDWSEEGSDSSKSNMSNWVVEPLSQPIDTGCSFFVYGSLRPDDVTGMPWRDGWLEGSTSQRGIIQGKMYDDSYASVVLDYSDNGGNNTVQGWLVEYPPSIYDQKLIEGDRIEGYPDLYDRKRVPVRLMDGTYIMAWVYIRPNCNKETIVPNGDWVEYQKTIQAKESITTKTTATTSLIDVQKTGKPPEKLLPTSPSSRTSKNTQYLSNLNNPTDGQFGPITVMALQQFLLSQGYMQNLQKPVDGDFGPTTIKELQKYLLAFERGY
jgi:gamma-glutamylcyclotransferase (GGCT)/AIG2-like uncharacterized protein YtfP